LWRALRYTERNPVRAGLVAEPAGWEWSSAAAHGGVAEPDVCLNIDLWRRCWNAESWRRFLEEGETESEIADLRRSTHSGRPLGGVEFIASLEQRTLRRLTPRKGGRSCQPLGDDRQGTLTLGR
jgi:putative transposase